MRENRGFLRQPMDSPLQQKSRTKREAKSVKGRTISSAFTKIEG